MGSISAPDGWSVITGDWGTDLDRENVNVYLGANCIRLKNTTVATKIRTPPALTPQNSYAGFYTGSGGINTAPIANWWFIRASSVAAGNTVTIKQEVYGVDGSLLYTVTAFTGVLPAANQWFCIGKLLALASTDTGHMRLTIEKAANAFDVYVNYIHAEHSAPIGLAFAGGTDDVTDDGAWHPIEFGTYTPYDVDILKDGAANIGFMIVQPGTYNISGQVMTNTVVTDLEVRVKIDVGTGAYYIDLGFLTSSKRASFSTNFILDYNESVVLEANTNGGGAAQVWISSTSGSDYTWHTFMNVARIGR